jgi:hypothetical protein
VINLTLTDDHHLLHAHMAVFAVLEQPSLQHVEEFRDCMRRWNDERACMLDRHLADRRRQVVPRQEHGWKNVFKVPPSARNT